MAFLGDLIVKMGANISPFQSKLDEAKKSTNSFQSSIESIGTKAAGFLNPITAGLTVLAGGAIAAGAAIYGLQSNIANLAGVADQSIQTGLDGAFLQRLGYAADQSGVSVETLTKGIKKLTVQIGNGDAKIFDNIGLSIRELEKLSPEDQFRKVAERIGEIPTAAGRAAAAVKIFGKSGIEMTGLFAGGMKDLNALLKDAENLGIGVSDEGLAKAAAADDAIQRMKASFGALLDQVTVGLAPAFEYVATTIADMIPPVTKLFAKFNELSDKAQFLSDILDASMSVAFESIKANWDLMLGEMIVAATKAGREIASGIASPGAAIGKFIGGRVGRAVGGPNAAPGQTPLDTAKQNLDSVLARLDAVKPFVEQGPKTPVKDDGSKLKDLFGGIAESAGPLIEGMKAKIGQEIGAAKITGNWFAETAKNLIGDKIKDPKEAMEEKPAGKIETQFAGAMQRGSAEAYSTIVAAMRGNKDPQVKAIDKSTKAIVAAVKGNKPPQPKVIGAFA